MKSSKALIPAALLLALLTGCASTGKTEAETQQPAAEAPAAAPASTPAAAAPAAPQPKTRAVDSIDGKKEVAYKCGDKGQYNTPQKLDQKIVVNKIE